MSNPKRLTSHSGEEADENDDHPLQENNDDNVDDERKPPARVVFLGSNDDGGGENDRNATNDNSNNNLVLAAAVVDNDSISTRSTAVPVSAMMMIPPQNHHPPNLQPPQHRREDDRPDVTAVTPGSVVSPEMAAKLASQEEHLLMNHHQPHNDVSGYGEALIPSMKSLRERRNQMLQDELFLWTGTATVSFVVLLYILLPSLALLALSTFSASLFLMLYTLYRAAWAAYHTAVHEGRGLGEYFLPESVLRTLTQQTFHEYMSDPTFGLENRHLMLYFLPISTEQLEAAIQRLAPRHRERLYRPGLGHLFLGEQVMRILLGDERYRQQQYNYANSNNTATGGQPQQQALPAPPLPPAAAAATTTAPPRQEQRQQRNLLFDDDDGSDLGLQVQEQDLVGGLNEQQATRVARSIGLVSHSSRPAAAVSTNTTSTTRGASAAAPAVLSSRNSTRAVAAAPPPTTTTPAISPQEQAAYDEEARVLTDAITDMAYSSVWNPVTSYVSSYVSDWFGQVTRPLVAGVARYGLRLSLLSTSVGLLGSNRRMVSGILASPLALPATTTLFGLRWAVFPRSLPSRQDHPAAHAIWTMAVWSGASAAVALGVQSYWWNRSRSSSGGGSRTMSSTMTMTSLWTSAVVGVPPPPGPSQPASDSASQQNDKKKEN